MTRILELINLKNKVALVTGGAAGIGVWMAKALAEVGADIIISGRGKHGSLEDTAAEIEKLGVKCIGIKCDVGNESQVINMVKKSVDEFGKIDILVNNAGITWGSPSEEMTLDNWSKVIQTNLTGTFLVSREVGKQMISQKQGNIINITSLWAFRGAEWGAIGYASSKAGVVGLTQQLAIEWAKYNIRVNGIALSWFPSGMSKFFIQNFGRVIKKATPLKRVGNEDDIKGVIVFLASNASSYITGQIICVDGGVLARMGMSF
ncbi:MAG: SDR family oxidoreductase [Candidatus Helarchaeota archaeon]